MDAQKYINDITLIAINKLIKENNQKLAKVHNQFCESWRVKYRSKFSFPKYQLIHIGRKRNINYTVGVKLKKGHLLQEISIQVNHGIIF